jgi:hypothetical protein
MKHASVPEARANLGAEDRSAYERFHHLERLRRTSGLSYDQMQELEVLTRRLVSIGAIQDPWNSH